MVSIDEVARTAGVSSATVSRALSGRGHVSPLTREKVLRVAGELGYVVSSAASSLASGRSRNIGVMLPDLHRWFFSTVLTGISEELSRRGYDLTLYNVSDDEALRREIFSSFLRRRRVDGLIVVAMELDAEEIDQLTQLGIPVLTLGGSNPRLFGRAVDDHALARLAVEHLLRLGHTRIGRIGAEASFNRDFHIPARREAGFRDALAEAGLEADPRLCVTADFTIEGGHRAAKLILGRSEAAPTGLVAFSDEMAIGALLAARELGLEVPQDISVVGMDGHDLGPLFGLTTVDQHPLNQGGQAARDILERIEDPRPAGSGSDPADGPPVPDSAATSAEAARSLSGPEQVPGPLPYELVVRSSTSAPRMA
ncbi:substrate-binding domain-containing protein [Nesterenkonia xinjiangensis]|uniref:DNA-binding LacI/PurR family transcriptional regulator n=1 Tax=Nesterenkonia xinjiangensis TaxID=225327 RepID=A0A7Z0GP61_9MICC|nr:DNA-binding LacI/PurR family transcriptional regulator [Nesterenkonia xinjiangensis]